MRSVTRAVLLTVAALCVAAPASARPKALVDLSELIDAAGLEESIIDTLVHLAEDPNDVGAHINLGNLYARQGKLDLAERAYLRALKLDDHDPIAWNNLGVLHLRQGDERKAYSCFDEAVDQDEKYAVARYNLAGILDSRGDYDRAVEEYRIAIGQRPDLASVRSNPYVVNNPHLVTVSLLNYLNREVYSLLMERAPDRLGQKILGIAEQVTPPAR